MIAAVAPQPTGTLDIAPAPSIGSARILLVDDEPINIKVVRKHLASAGYADFYSTCEPAEVLGLAECVEPDIVLLDVVMPEITGLQLLGQIRRNPRIGSTPVVMLTASADKAVRCEALELGATDFLAKPVDRSELVSRVRNVLTVKAQHDALQRHMAELERIVQERTAELEASHRNLIHCLARAAEFRDDDTGQHVLRVGRYAGIIARQLGWGEAQVEMLELAAQLHDVGKIGIPDTVLLKPDKLTPEEFELMQKHCGLIVDPLDVWWRTPDVDPVTVWRKVHAVTQCDLMLACSPSMADTMHAAGVETVLAPHHADPRIRADWHNPNWPVVYAGLPEFLGHQRQAIAEALPCHRMRVHRP